MTENYKEKYFKVEEKMPENNILVELKRISRELAKSVVYGKKY